MKDKDKSTKDIKDKSSKDIKDKSSKTIKDKDAKKDKSKDKDKKHEKSSKSNKVKTKEKSENLEEANISKEIDKSEKVYEQCDGCYSHTGEIYCSSCEMVLCNACEEQIHIIPSNQNHERFPLNNLKHVKKQCYHHKSSLQFYCESCDEPVCKECTIQGPHNTKLHKVVNVIESFKKKHSYLSSLINKSLSIKLDHLENQLQYIENIGNEVKESADFIFKEINNEYTGHLSSLKDQEGKKLALIQYNYNDLVADISSINDIMSYFNSVEMSQDPDMTEFLLKYKQISETVENILNKHPRDYTELEVNADDFEQPLELVNKKLEKFDKLKDVLKVKDDIIWSLINENKSNVMSEEFFKTKRDLEEEIEGWARLSFKYLSELKKFNQVCAFCGVKLDSKSVNSQCPKNNENYAKTVEKSTSLKIKFSDVQIPSISIMNNYHYFGQPSQDYDDKVNKTLYTNHIISKSKDKILETDILIVFDKMRKKAKLMGVDIEKNITKFFNDETGYLDASELKKYLVSTYELTTNEAEIVINKLQRKKEYEYPTYNSTRGNYKFNKLFFYIYKFTIYKR